MPPRKRTEPKPDPVEKQLDEAPKIEVTEVRTLGFWEQLSRPFETSWVEKLPKQLSSAKDQYKGRCEDTTNGRKVSADGVFCGGWHARAVHLDYIGHAGITMRLNEVCTPAGWDWQPMVNTPDGFPSVGAKEFWIVLSIFDPDQEKWVEKQGVGDDYHGSSKQAIGDALRNAAMRFGIGTYLWSKSEHAATMAGVESGDGEVDQQSQQPIKPSPSEVVEAMRRDWNDLERMTALRDDIISFGYTAVQTRASSGQQVSILDFAEARIMFLAEQVHIEKQKRRQEQQGAADEDPAPPAADPVVEPEAPAPVTDVDKIRAAAEQTEADRIAAEEAAAEAADGVNGDPAPDEIGDQS